MQIKAIHIETGQKVQGLLTTAKRALPKTWHNWNLDPQELVIKEKIGKYATVYELSKMKNIKEV